MLAQLIREVRSTLLNPRAYAREVMFRRNYGLRELATIGALAATLYAIAAVIIIKLAASIDDAEVQSLALDQIDSTEVAFSMFVNVALSLVLTWIGAWKIGAMAGGKGGPRNVASAVVWSSLCVIVAMPLFVFVGLIAAALMMVTGMSLFIVVSVVGIFLFSLWLEASLIGEAHGFPNTLVVAVFLLGGNVVVSLISNAIFT